MRKLPLPTASEIAFKSRFGLGAYLAGRYRRESAQSLLERWIFWLDIAEGDPTVICRYYEELKRQFKTKRPLRFECFRLVKREGQEDEMRDLEDVSS